MSFVFIHASNNMFARAKARRATIGVLDNGDVYTTGEAQKDHAYLRGRPGFDEYVVGELAIGWDREKFEKVGSWHETVMAGGRRGALGSSSRDRRRRGPSRLVALVVLRELATDQLVIVPTHHGIAKPDTTAKWRRPLRDQGFAKVADVIARFRAKYPTAATVFAGDLNTRGRIAIFLRAGLNELVTPATFGRLRYDRIYYHGARVRLIRKKKTGTDHLALVARVTL